jgi:hypothetical protein
VYPTEGVFFSFTAISARYFNILLFLNQWVSLKDEREFTNSKFQQIINSTAHCILCMGGSSIPQDSGHGTFLGVSIFPSKMGPFAPFSATIQALSRIRAFLLSENE